VSSRQEEGGNRVAAFLTIHGLLLRWVLLLKPAISHLLLEEAVHLIRKILRPRLVRLLLRLPVARPGEKLLEDGCVVGVVSHDRKPHRAEHGPLVWPPGSMAPR
jgi:hypothetical protein